MACPCSWGSAGSSFLRGEGRARLRGVVVGEVFMGRLELLLLGGATAERRRAAGGGEGGSSRAAEGEAAEAEVEGVERVEGIASRFCSSSESTCENERNVGVQPPSLSRASSLDLVAPLALALSFPPHSLLVAAVMSAA